MTQVPEIDFRLGLRAYSTPTEGIGGKIRQNPESFKVEELLSQDIIGDISKKRKKYAVLKVEKKNLTTLSAVAILQRKLHSKVRFLGLKDARSVSSQYFFARSNSLKEHESIEAYPLSVEVLGYVDEAPSRGSLIGNRFEVNVSSCDLAQGELEVGEIRESVANGKILNFYGYQRFGGASYPTTLEVGFAILRGNMRGAVELLTAGEPNLSSREERIEEKIRTSIQKYPSNFVGALRLVPITLRRLYVQAVQSYLFNRALSVILDQEEVINRPARGDFVLNNGHEVTKMTRNFDSFGEKENQKLLLQIPGFAFRRVGRFDEITQEVLDEEGISPRHFFVKSIPEISQEGAFREIQLRSATFDFEVCERNSLLLTTEIGKGSYMTILLREIMKPQDPAASGF